MICLENPPEARMTSSDRPTRPDPATSGPGGPDRDGRLGAPTGTPLGASGSTDAVVCFDLPGLPSGPPTPEPDPRRWWILAVLGLAQLMVVLDGTIVNIALPSAQADLGFGDEYRQWVITAYALGFGSLLLVGGRLADRFGRREMFLVGLVGFAVASAVGGTATTIGQLLVARAVQGVFGALLAPAVLSALTTTFPDVKERGRAFGVFGAVAGSGAAIGLLLGGALTEWFSWRWCLFVNLGFAAVAFVGAWVLLPRGQERNRTPMDWPGVVTVCLGLFAVVYGFSLAETDGWLAAQTLSMLGGGAALLLAFVAIEARSTHALLPLRVVADRDRGGAMMSIFLTGLGMFGVFLFLTFYMQQILGFSPVVSGVGFLPMAALIVVTSAVSGSLLVPRYSPKLMMPVGMLVAAAGLVLFTRITVGGDFVTHVLPASLVFGLGLGLVFSFSTNVATRGIRPGDAGVGSAMVNVAQQIGAAIGTSLLNTVAANATIAWLTDHRPTPTATADQAAMLQAEAAVRGYTVAFWVSAGVFTVGALVTAVLLRPGVVAPDPHAAPATG